MASFSSFLSWGHIRTACFRCWMRCRLDCLWRLASASLEAAVAAAAAEAPEAPGPAPAEDSGDRDDISASFLFFLPSRI